MLDFNARWPDVRIGDIFYVLGHAFPTPADWRKIQEKRWYDKFPKRFPHSWPRESLSHAYQAHCHRYSCEPRFMRHLPTRVTRLLRTEWLTGEYFEPLEFHLRYREELGYICAIQSDGFLHDFDNALGLCSRLSYIRQLGFLHDPVVNEAVADAGLAMRFEHTRYMHSSRVMATASLMGRQIGLNEYFMRHLQGASFSHDVLTPAGGDSVKPLDFAAFDEDAHYPEAFRNNPAWAAVRAKYQLNEKLLAETVAGQGILGQLLDLADKTTYVAHDVDAYLKGNHNPRQYRYIPAPESILAIWDLRQKLGPGCCQLWDKITVRDGHVVITDVPAWVGFLTLRALMFRHVYYNPFARYREHMIAILVLEPLYHEGAITREILLTMTDPDLERYLERVTGYDFRLEMSQTRNAPAIEAFATRAEALGRIRALTQDNPELYFMLEEIPRVSEKAVHHFVLDRRQRAQPLLEAYPEEAEMIRAIDFDPRPVKLYILTPGKVERFLTPALREKLRVRQRQLFGLE